MTITGLVAIVTIALVVAGYTVVRPMVVGDDGIEVAIDVSSVGPGVAAGTQVMLRGARVGEVEAVEEKDDHTLRMMVRLNDPSVEITDSVGVDFRPQNYFGIAAVNLETKHGGARLTNGSVLNRTSDVADYTMSTMLEKGSESINGSLTNQMVKSLDKVVNYTDGLTPLIDTAVEFADIVAREQVELPADLLAKMNDILVVMPSFSGNAIDTLKVLYNTKFNQGPDGFRVDDVMMERSGLGLKIASEDLYGRAGRLLASHKNELLPGTQAIGAIVGVLPHFLVNGTALGQISTIAQRYDRAMTKNREGNVTLNLRVVLDSLPAVTTPLSLTELPNGNEGPR
ncbi:MlaD family protein [Gordonia sp. KTR9]|uniref:MlaD family protein n=1 Tax=Gordonia sp. KTR9 TaxID=337191 RepID=UPI0011D1DF60|nr:MlaD family protein [Gordonia sp. KTR9]